MTHPTHLKTRLGKRFSEGSRRLWLVVEARGWNQATLAADVLAARAKRGAPPPEPAETRRSKRPNTSVVSRWLYGERAPDRDSALLLKELYGIDARLWSEEPEAPFTPPAAREAA